MPRRRFAGAPTTLQGGLGSITGFAANETNVYAAADNAIFVCSAGACTSEPHPSPRSLALGASSLTFANFGGIYTCPLDGCGAAPPVQLSTTKLLATEFASALAVVTAPASLGLPDLSSCAASGCVSPPLHVQSCNAAGCGVPATPGSDWVLGAYGEVATDGSTLYVREDDRILACPLSGCGAGARIIASGLGSFLGISTTNLATDGTDLYFFDGGSNDPFVYPNGAVQAPPWRTTIANLRLRLLRCPVAGCPPEGPTLLWVAEAPIPTFGATRSIRVALDANNIYFTAVRLDGVALVSTPR